ncbi:MAG: Beta-propeller repeat protein [Syntrophorhabdus sp. PtaB.Bin047]|jgi:hypothetical protein|nr:MAG: Beta-propeller repeat protein [Syntrophorhabdus sp. PtaB.Bin047]
MNKRNSRFFITYFFTSLFLLLFLLQVFPNIALAKKSSGTYLWHLFTGSGVNVDKGAENVRAVVTDEAGNIFIAAEGMKWDSTQATDPNYGSPGDPKHPHSGNNPINKDILVIKLGPNGQFEWYTFYGGFEGDNVRGMAIADGKLYITGTSRDNWSGPNGKSAVQDHSRAILHPSHCSGGGYYYYEYSDDIFVLALDKYYGKYLWHTFIGESKWNEQVYGIAADKERIFLVGKADAEFFGCWPVTEPNRDDEPMTDCDAVKRINRKCRPTRQYQGSNDAWVLALDTNGYYVAHTFLGGSESNDWGEGIAIDKNGMVVVAGASDQSWNYTHSWYNTPPRNPHSGGYDMFIARLARSDLECHWHAFFGGPDSDWATAVLTDDENGYYLAGYSKSGFKVKDRAPVAEHTAGVNYDFSVLKMNNEGANGWHTFRGRDKHEDVAHAMALSLDGKTLYVAGEANGPWVQGADGAPLHDFTKLNGNYQIGVTDMAILALDASNGKSRWHSFYGGLGHDRAYSIAVAEEKAAGDIIVGGTSDVAWTVDGTASKYTFPDNGASSTTPNPNFAVLKLHPYKYTITASVNDEKMGSVSPKEVDVEYQGNTTVKFQHKPAYRVKGLFVDGTYQECLYCTEYSFEKVSKDHTLKVVFDNWKPTIINEGNDGGGTLDPPDQEVEVEYGKDQTMNFIPDEGYEVASVWIDDVEWPDYVYNAYTFKNVVRVHTIQVNFRKKKGPYTITPNAGANGSVTPGTKQTVSRGSNITLTVQADAGHVIDTLVKVQNGITNTITNASGQEKFETTFANVQMNGSLTATFKQPVYTIEPTVSGGNGTIDPSKSTKVVRGQDQTFNFKPADGYELDKVYVDGTEQVNYVYNAYTFKNVKANHAITISFRKKSADATYTITPMAGANGSINPGTALTVKRGATRTFTVTANEGYEIDTLTKIENGITSTITAASGQTSFQTTFSTITYNGSLKATFRTYTGSFTITPDAGANGSITPGTAQTVAHSGSTTFEVKSATGYVIDTLTVVENGQKRTIDGAAGKPTYSQSFTNVHANGSITVTFAKSYTITPSVTGANGSITPGTAQTVKSGGTVTFTVSAEANYQIERLSVFENGVSRDIGGAVGETTYDYPFSNVQADGWIVAKFKAKSDY